MWPSCVQHDVTMWTSGVQHDVTMWYSCVQHDVTMWSSCVHNDVTVWLAMYSMTSQCDLGMHMTPQFDLPYVQHDVAMWPSYVQYDVTMWTSCVQHDVTMWLSCAQHDVAMWFSRVQHDITMWPSCVCTARRHNVTFLCTAWRHNVTLLYPTGKPSAPALVEVANVTDDSVTISWLSPERDGGARIFRYGIELNDASRAEGWVKVKEVDASDLPVTCIDGLKEGKSYRFRVYAENEVGAGPAAELRHTVVPRAQMCKCKSQSRGLWFVYLACPPLMDHTTLNSYYWDCYPGALSVSQVTATRLKIGTSRWNLWVPDLQMSCNGLLPICVLSI